MKEEQKSYRQILKATSIFGGVQAFNVIISILRSKVIAVIIGPAGMGIVNLFISSTGFISSLTNFGLGTSAVKNVAAEAATGNRSRIELIITVLRKLVWITGITGLVLTAVLSPWLSRLVFGSKEYTLGFIWISVSVLFQQLSSGQLVVLQGLRRIKDLAKANLLGAITGLVISLLLYYRWKLEAVVPVIILSSIASMFFSWFYAKRSQIGSVKVTRQQVLTEGRDMLRMGFMINLSTLIAIGASFIVRIYMSNTGGVEQVGLYSAGFAIINTYVSMIFTAMYTDYYPRLSAIAQDNNKARSLINHEAEVALLILAPIIAIFLVFINWAIIILYSRDFLAVNEMIHWAALGMYFKVMSWSVASLFLAKGASKLFFWNEFSQTVYTLALNIAGYAMMGLEGLGISFLISFLVYAVQVFIVARRHYEFSFNSSFVKIGIVQFVIGLACFFIVRKVPQPWTYISGTGLILVSLFISFRELDKRIMLVSLLKEKYDIKG